MVNEPTSVFAVRVEAVAEPVQSVSTLSISPLMNLALAPLEGAAKVTRIPDNRFPEESATTARRPAAKGAPTVVLCGVPAVAVTVPVGPAIFLSSKTAPLAMPVVVATT